MLNDKLHASEDLQDLVMLEFVEFKGCSRDRSRDRDRDRERDRERDISGNYPVGNKESSDEDFLF